MPQGESDEVYREENKVATEQRRAFHVVSRASDWLLDRGFSSFVDDDPKLKPGGPEVDYELVERYVRDEVNFEEQVNVFRLGRTYETWDQEIEKGFNRVCEEIFQGKDGKPPVLTEEMALEMQRDHMNQWLDREMERAKGKQETEPKDGGPEVDSTLVDKYVRGEASFAEVDRVEALEREYKIWRTAIETAEEAHEDLVEDVREGKQDSSTLKQSDAANEGSWGEKEHRRNTYRDRRGLE